MKKKSKVLFVTIDGGGNLPPVLGLAQILSERGYGIAVLSEPCMKEVAISLGFEFIPFRSYFTRTDRKEDLFKDWNSSAMNNPVLEKISLGPSRVVAEETMDALVAIDAGLLVADLLLPAALIASEARNIPGVVAFHMPEYLPGPNRPPGMLGLTPGNGAAARFRNRILATMFNRKINRYLPVINEIRMRWDLPSLERTGDLYHHADLRLIQTLERFDFPIEPRPSNVRYTGPFLNDPDWASTWSNPWPEDDQRPLVVISLSSTFQNQHAAIQSAIDALRDQDVRGLVTLGPALEKESYTAPENVIIVDAAPHSLVFPRASLVITHAGHGTVMKALSHGLPLVCLPMGRDQNDNAAKIEYHGCGIALKRNARPEKIRKAVQRILSESSFRQSAKQFQAEIGSGGPDGEIVREIENLILPSGNNKQPVKRHQAGLQAEQTLSQF